MSSHWNSSNSVQKAVPAKNRRKMSIKDLNVQIKKFMDLVVLNRTGHMSFLNGQDQTPKFAD